METAKAVVDVPSPFSGKVTKLHGKNGDVIDTGAALVEIELDPKLPQRAEAESTGHHHGPPKAAPAHTVGTPAPDNAKKVIASDDGGEIPAGGKAPARADAGTVVGAMEASDRVHSEQAVAVGGIKAVPAVRALAKKLNVDLSKVIPTGAGGVATMQDVKNAAAAEPQHALVPISPPSPSREVGFMDPGKTADQYGANTQMSWLHRRMFTAASFSIILISHYHAADTGCFISSCRSRHGTIFTGQLVFY